MKYFIKILIILCLAFGEIFAQEMTMQIEQIEKAFNQFEYQNVIRQSEKVLDRGDSLDSSQMIELLRMKATAHYVLGQEDMAALSIVNILKIGPQYELDPIINSPKLISFFKKVRENYQPARVEKKPELPQAKVVLKPAVPPPIISLWRSVLLPGWGHLHAGQKGKGALLLSASVITMEASAYLVVETSNLETEYLNKTVQVKIDKSYKKYNRYYRLRNGFLAACALVWIYAQFDLSSEIKINSKQRLSLHPSVVQGKNAVVGFRLKYTF